MVPGSYKVCGDVEEGQAIAHCGCGLFRQADKPHAYVIPKSAPMPRAAPIDSISDNHREISMAIDTAARGPSEEQEPFDPMCRDCTRPNATVCQSHAPRPAPSSGAETITDNHTHQSRCYHPDSALGCTLCALDALIGYVGAAKVEAGKRGRVCGQPLNEWIALLPLDVGPA